jgi:hypothetical protein
MADKDITRINVGNFPVSIVGLKDLLQEMSRTHGSAPDDEVGLFMLERLGQTNYIPNGAKEDYRRAFVREFRKSLGQPWEEDAPRGLDVKVLGAGCGQCHSLTGLVMEVLTEIGVPAGVEHVMDLREIARFGVMGSPALLVNGKVVAVGSVPPRDRIKKWLLEANASLAGK